MVMLNVVDENGNAVGIVQRSYDEKDKDHVYMVVVTVLTFPFIFT